MIECKKNILQTLEIVARLHNDMTIHYVEENRKKLKKTCKKIKELNENTKELKKDVYVTLKKLKDDSVDTGHHYVQILDYLRETAHCLNFIAEPFIEQLDNAHPSVIPEQETEILNLMPGFQSCLVKFFRSLKKSKFDGIPSVIQQNSEIIAQLEKSKKVPD
jgi:hypothetical protein